MICIVISNTSNKDTLIHTCSNISTTWINAVTIGSKLLSKNLLETGILAWKRASTLFFVNNGEFVLEDSVGEILVIHLHKHIENKFLQDEIKSPIN